MNLLESKIKYIKIVIKIFYINQNLLNLVKKKYLDTDCKTIEDNKQCANNNEIKEMRIKIGQKIIIIVTGMTALLQYTVFASEINFKLGEKINHLFKIFKNDINFWIIETKKFNCEFFKYNNEFKNDVVNQFFNLYRRFKI